MLVNHWPAEAVELLEDATNEQIVEAVIEDVGAGKERRGGNNAFGKVIYLHALVLCCCAEAFLEEKIKAPKYLQRL